MPNPNLPAKTTFDSYPVQLNLVPAMTGLTWFKQGLQTFVRQPLALGGLFFMALAFFQLLSYGLSVVGLLIWVVLTPAVNIGFMAAMAEAHQGRFPMPRRLLTAFSKGSVKTKPVLILGALYLAGLFLLAALVGLLFGSELAAMAKASQDALGVTAPSPGVGQAASSASAAATGATELTSDVPGFLWLFLLLGVPITLVTWHAPPLVFWYGTTPIKALFFSAVACWRNMGAMLVYFLAWAALSAPIMLASAMLQEQAESGFNLVLMALLAPVSLALGAAFTLSAFFTFQGCFVQRAPLP
jgi:hypothetical protein